MPNNSLKTIKSLKKYPSGMGVEKFAFLFTYGIWKQLTYAKPCP
jgi:hypothetical protein